MTRVGADSCFVPLSFVPRCLSLYSSQAPGDSSGMDPGLSESSPVSGRSEMASRVINKNKNKNAQKTDLHTATNHTLSLAILIPASIPKYIPPPRRGCCSYHDNPQTCNMQHATCWRNSKPTRLTRLLSQPSDDSVAGPPDTKRRRRCRCPSPFPSHRVGPVSAGPAMPVDWSQANGMMGSGCPTGKPAEAKV